MTATVPNTSGLNAIKRELCWISFPSSFDFYTESSLDLLLGVVSRAVGWPVVELSAQKRSFKIRTSLPLAGVCCLGFSKLKCCSGKAECSIFFNCSSLWREWALGFNLCIVRSYEQKKKKCKRFYNLTGFFFFFFNWYLWNFTFKQYLTWF